MSHFITQDGCHLEYHLRGQGPLIALTPGGREGGAGVSKLAEALAVENLSVLTWDRRNGGASDVFFGAAPLAEAEIWAEDLADLIAHLDRGPAWIAGGSGGCRTSVISVLRRPGEAKGLIAWSASGGQFASQFLGFQYHVPYIMAAMRGGMEAVIQTPYWADRIAARPANRECLLALDPQEFIATMKRWMSAFYYRPDSTLTGVRDEQLEAIAVPTLIFEGTDDVHPKSVSDRMAQLIPQATYQPSPWSSNEFLERFSGRIAAPVVDLYPKLVPDIAAFLRKNG
jgi:2-hydroxy-6-oxonona-2,4-dienedioate hydrolase